MTAPLSGKAWRDAVRAATSKLHATQRTGKGRYREKKNPARRPAAGMIRIQPPPKQPPADPPEAEGGDDA
jgi:hypothetical protein